MKSYELTERGKIIIAVVLVILLLVLPSTILAIKAWAGTAPPPDDPPVTASPLPATADDDLPENPEPLPDGSGSDPLEHEDDPTDVPADNPADDEADDPTDEPADDPAVEPTDQVPPPSDNGEDGSSDTPGEPQEFGPVSLDISKGTMVFIFSPALQDTLDPETTAMLGEFITSPKNKADTQIMVEMPSLSQKDTTTVISAVTNAFARYDVTRKDLVFITLQTVAQEGPFEVILSFYDPPRNDPPSPK